MLRDLIQLLLAPSAALYFSSPKAPAPAPLPVAPSQSQDDQKARQMAEREALETEARSGRKTTIFAGRDDALNEQQGIGLLAQKKRAAAGDLLS